MTQKRGLNFDPVLEPFWGPLETPLGPCGDPWGPQGAKKCLKAFPKRGLKRVRKRDSKKSSMFDPHEYLKLCSRLSGSTVLHILPGSILDLILEPFWLRFGGHLEPHVAQEASESPPRLQHGSKKATQKTSCFWVPFWSQNGSKTGGGFFDGMGSWEGLGTSPEPPGANLVLGCS